MKRTTLVLLAAVIVSAAPEAQAAPTPKLGSTCVKPGQLTTVKPSMQKLICSKAGKKLVWAKYSPPVVSAPVAPQNTTPVTPKLATIDPIREATFSSVKAMNCSSSHSHIVVEKFVGTNMPADVKTAVDAEIERTLNCYDSFFDSTIALKIAYVTEKDTDLVKNTLASIMGPQEVTNLNGVLNRYENRAWGPSGGSGGGVAGRNSFGTNYYLVLHQASYTSMNSYMLKNVMHEFAHVLQGYGRKDMRTQTSEGWYANVPGYFVEGGAEAIAYSFTSPTTSDYNFQMNRAAKSQTGGSPTARNISDFAGAKALLETLKSPSTQEARDVQYPFGAFVCDYLIGKYGVEKFLALMKGASKYPQWSENIQSTLGVSQEEFETSALNWLLPLWKTANS